MPELPEVETVIRGLSILQGKQLLSVKLYNDKWRHPVPFKDIQTQIGNTVIDLKRRAKWPALVFNSGCLWLHLGMTGQLIIYNLIDLPERKKHDHLDLFFSENLVLRFTDPRRFGVVAWTEGASSEPPSKQKLGFEPFDISWTDNMFYSQLQKINKNIKVTLMEGKQVVGVGNIYASESLFLSHISPLRSSNTLTFEESSLLRKNIIEILEKSINHGGSTLKDHRQANGEKGSYQDNHLIYGKEGKPCPVCSNKIIKIEQGGRSTFYCSFCQH